MIILAIITAAIALFAAYWIGYSHGMAERQRQYLEIKPERRPFTVAGDFAP